MKLPNSKNPFWEIAFIVSVFAVFTWRLQANATHFDSTEIATIIESGAWAVSAVSALLYFRGRK